MVVHEKASLLVENDSMNKMDYKSTASLSRLGFGENID
jgi:hypothetical protein